MICSIITPLGLLAVPREQVIRIHASSGTKGKPKIVAYTRNDIDIWGEVVARALVCAGVRPGEVVHNAYGYGLFTGGLGVHYGCEYLGATVVPISSGNTQRQIMLLHDLQATTLTCTPSYALTIAETLTNMGLGPDDLCLKRGIFGAEPWTEGLRSQVEKGLGIQALDIYGLSEVMGPGVAMECAEEGQISEGGTRTLHVFEDHFLPEKELTTMNEKASNEAQIVESWIDLANNTTAGYPTEPIVEALAQAQHGPKEDPWVTLIDRLWDANPVSEVVPIDLGEIVSIFQRVWLDVLRNPTRLWGLYSNFALQSTQIMTSSTLAFWGADTQSKPV